MSDELAPMLPPSATPLERAAAEAAAEIQRTPVLLRELWDPWECPAKILPYLAWAFSVDRWDTAWSDTAKREVIASAYFVHKKKGTIGALRRVVEPLGYLLRVTEWWQTEPPGTPGTFALKIGVLETGITDEMYLELERLIDDAKPLTRHITGLDLAGETTGAMYVGIGMYDGDVTAVLPYQPGAAVSTGPLYAGAATDSFDEATVYPQ